MIATCTGGRDLVDNRDSRGVLYTERPMAHYELLLERLGFQTVEGPATFSKGNQSERLFQESADRKAVVIPANLWKELSLLGHWIRDSLIFEWARVSASFAALKPEQRPRIMAEHLAVLLQHEIPERFTGEAQALYNSNAEPECVWTGRKLRTQFHVDHVIPYSQWHTNAWWNQMPSSAQANLSKSDKLPSHEVLAQARPRLMQNWDLAMRRYESDFTFEVKRDFLGSGPLGDWQSHLFDALNDRIETMAELRGLARWPGASSPQR